MSKLTEKATERLINTIARHHHADVPTSHQRFDRILQDNHPLTAQAKNMMLIYGNASHINRILDSPHLTTMNLSVARDSIDELPRHRQKDLSSKLMSNFPNAVEAIYDVNSARKTARSPDEKIEASKLYDIRHDNVNHRSKIEESTDFTVTHEGWHGTPDARDIRTGGFKTVKQRYGNEDPSAVYWAAKDHKTAKSYANPHLAFDYQNSEPAVLPVQMQMKNPKVIHWGGRKFRGKDETTGERYAIDDHIEQARKDGHDGFVVHGIIDNYHADGKPTTIMGVFHPNNIRVKR